MSMRVSLRTATWALTGALNACVMCCAMGCDGGAPALPRDAEPDALDADVVRDALPDVAPVYPDAAPVWDAGPVVDAVAGSVIKLPPSGQNRMGWLSHGHPYVAYSEWRDTGSDHDYDIFYYDLTTATEVTVTDAPRDQMGPIVLGNEIYWSDGRYYTPTNLRKEVFCYDIATQSESQITNDGSYLRLRGVTDSHMLYITKEGLPPETGGGNLVLMDRQSGETRLLSEYFWGAGWSQLSDTHVSWAAYTQFDWGLNQSVYLHDIAADQTQLLQSTIPGNQAGTSMQGDWLLWTDNRNGDYDIYRYRISTGVEERLTDEPHDQVGPVIGGNLLVWMDFRYTGGTWDYFSNFGVDLVLYDMDNGVWRKLTGWSDLWMPGDRPQAGWLVYTKLTGQPGIEIYAMDLVGNLLIDATGHVIP